MKFKSVSIYLLIYLILFCSIFLSLMTTIIGGVISIIYIYYKTGLWDLSLGTLWNSAKGSFFGGMFFGLCIWIVAKFSEKKTDQEQHDNGLYRCPCCYNQVLHKEGKEETCSVCGWIDDPLQSLDPDYKNGFNKISLNEAIAVNQKNFKKEIK